MRIAIFAFTADSKALKTGVTTYNKVLLKSLIRYDSDNQYNIFLSEGNSKSFADIEGANLKKNDH